MSVDASGTRTALEELLATALGSRPRADPASPHTGGPAGNARLTAWTGLLLLVFFAVEGVTLLWLRQLMSVHILIGAFLVPLVLLKTATTGWRIGRYYLGAAGYRMAGPPPLALRLLGPFVVLASLAVLGSGIALIVLGPSSYTPLVGFAGFSVDAVTVHQATFIGWLAVTGLHVLARTLPALEVAAQPDRPARRVAGGVARGATLLLTGGLGVGAALFVLHLSTAWTGGAGLGGG